jgi:hypothetical protein
LYEKYYTHGTFSLRTYNKSTFVYIYTDIYRLGGIFEAHLRIVKKSGVIPFVVFDGFALPAKASKHERWQM